MSGKKGEKTPADLDVEDKTFEIVFDNKIMISKLVSICTDLVKQIKITGFHSCSDEVAKLNFENIKLQVSKKFVGIYFFKCFI